MPTKLLMTSSAVFMGAVGVFLTFLPQETAGLFDMGSSKTIFLFMQILGGMYFGFAMINWMAKDNLIGGIYGRPVVVGNLSHFMIGGLALAKGAFGASAAVWGVTLVYCALAISFGIVMYSNPFKDKKDS